MQVAVRLRRETGLNTSVIHSLSEVFLYNLLNKIEAAFLILRFLYFHNLSFNDTSGRGLNEINNHIAFG